MTGLVEARGHLGRRVAGGGLLVPKPYSPEQIVGTLNDLTGAPALPARPKQSDIAAAQSNGQARIG
ncbi:hypothetical protein AB8A31_15205 [Tardiphaga sp. 804_B3_N1_9]|uniref:hypothetical protein n=1 Tax=Tardiphaga TaxID=1395974 RepID=UPI001586E684|nr:hypothetical protein [Tardiphaga robiniae]NUU42837.1 hypothetical protein [Tardiphaga robiniae]